VLVELRFALGGEPPPLIMRPLPDDHDDDAVEQAMLGDRL